MCYITTKAISFFLSIDDVSVLESILKTLAFDFPDLVVQWAGDNDWAQQLFVLLEKEDLFEERYYNEWFVE